MLAITNEGANYSCFAPNIDFLVTDNSNGKITTEYRNVPTEAARIARGKVADLASYRPDDFDALVFPGGLGVIKNLCDYYTKGISCNVNQDVANAVIATHNLKKPIVALCIAPVLLAIILKNIKITVGYDKNIAQQLEKIGTQTVFNDPTQITVDEKNKIITTPCYMNAKNIAEVAIGTSKAIKEAINMII